VQSATCSDPHCVKNAVFCDVTPCRSCVSRHFGGTLGSSETSVHIPEDDILHSRGLENFKYYFHIVYFNLSFPKSKTAGTWNRSLTSSWCRSHERLIHPHGAIITEAQGQLYHYTCQESNPNRSARDQLLHVPPRFVKNARNKWQKNRQGKKKKGKAIL
jgi:hypothetical protein